MMGSKLCWVGLTLIVAVPLLAPAVPWAVAGAIVMIVGCVLLVLDK